MKHLINRLICLVRGHKWVKETWVNVYRMNFNRKGGKRRNKGVSYHKVKHYRYVCYRCRKRR